MRLHRALAVTALLVLTACGASSPPASDPESAVADAEPSVATVEPTESAERTEEPAASATASAATASDACTPPDVPNLDTGWTSLEGLGGGFTVGYPDDWEDLSGQTDFTASTLLDEEIFSQLVRADDATIRADFVRAPDGLPNLSVFVFGPVGLDAAAIAAIEVARYEQLAGIERMVDTSIEACIGGEPARGLAVEFESSDGQTYYQQNLFAIHGGELVVVQWLDFAQDPDLELFEDILSTWEWASFGQ